MSPGKRGTSTSKERQTVDGAPATADFGGGRPDSRPARPKSSKDADGQPSSTSQGGLEIRIGDTSLHRAPADVARSLRYLLAGGDLPGRLAVTSSIHGEGVTSMSRTLAALIAHDWRVSTCWVDVNWWKTKPATGEAHLFDVTLADVVNDGASAGGLAAKTSIPDLSMVSAGEVPVASRSRMPKSERLSAVLDELSATYECVVLDLPPVLASSDALSLGGLADGFVLVVRQRSTSLAQVRAALRTMNTVPCLGTVLNGARSHVPRWLRTSNEVWALGERT